MAIAIVRQPFLRVTFADMVLESVFSAPVSAGLDQRVMEATVTVPTTPGVGTYKDRLLIEAGANVGTVRTIFDGELVQFGRSLYPRGVRLIGRGKLWKAQTYVNLEDPGSIPAVGDDPGEPGQGGLTLQDLVGGPATDQDIVMAILTKAGVDFDPDNIGGTGTIMGSQADDSFIWRVGTTALSQIEAIDAISAVYTSDTDPIGFYRTFETIGGVIYRTLVGGRPRNVADATYTEGVNISANPTSTRDILDLYNYVRVEGMDYGKGGRVAFTLPGSNPFQPIDEPHIFVAPQSNMIERATIAESGQGMAAETVAYAHSADKNREVVRVEGLETPLDDRVGPGATLLVQAIGGVPGRLGLGEKVWLQNMRINPTPAYKQTYTVLGGGPADGDPYLPEVPQ